MHRGSGCPGMPHAADTIYDDACQDRRRWAPIADADTLFQSTAGLYQSLSESVSYPYAY